MNLHRMLLERESAGRPVTVGLVGAGKFGTMFLSQAPTTAGMQVAAVADLDVGRARAQLHSAFGRRSALTPARSTTRSGAAAPTSRRTRRR